MAWAFVTGAANSTKTVTKNVTAGNLLVCGFAGSDGTTTPTISDGVNTWTPVSASPVFDTTNAASVSMWSAVAATTGSITITITFAPATFNGTWLGEWSGNAASGVNAGSAGAANIPGSLTAEAMKTGAFTPTADNCLIISFINDDGTTATTTQYTAGASPVVFTKRTTLSVDPAGASDTTYAVEDAVQGAAASINPSWTEAKIDAAVGIGAAFNPATAVAASANLGTNLHPGRSPGKAPFSARFWQPPGAGVAPATPVTTINEGVGAFAWAGTQSSLTKILTEGVGTYTWLGTISNVPRLVKAVPGAWAWAGTASPISKSINATKGVYTWSGTGSSIAASIGSRAGAYSWAGVAATLASPATLNATPGAYSWNGKTASFATLIQEGIGRWNWSGTQATLTTPGATAVTHLFPIPGRRTRR